MPTVEIESRLDLIQLIATCLSTALDSNDLDELRGLIEALCRHRELEVRGCLSPPRREILQRVGGDDFRDWTGKYLING